MEDKLLKLADELSRFARATVVKEIPGEIINAS
jgi:hypothetical protein